ncbi:hypothetical protein CXB51_031648 [Gossypium anomalum]|uniref:Uncharacterized protein n=1 Tax=Gossypium anomalum TaxID=47600 RepID=A0A8J6CP85_9ROSI|nr:hypothetical protein CXB51_031648 [Gossypium anomalum]
MSHVPYSSAVGSLMYAMVCSRPDLSYTVSAISRYMVNPELEMEPSGMLMLILLETFIEEVLSQVMSLQSEVVQLVGKPLCKLQSLCLPLKLSTWRY